MSAIIILVFISIAVAGIFLLLFYKAVSKGQYEEFESPAIRARILPVKALVKTKKAINGIIIIC